MTTLLRFSTCAAVAMTLIYASDALRAETIALQSFSSGSLSDARNGTLGWEFEVNSEITVTALGYWDQGADGLSGGHDVGIWDASGNLLVSSSVPSGTSATLENGFRYVSASATVLSPGNTYIVGASNPSDNTDFVGFSTASLVFDPMIALHNGRSVQRSIVVNPLFGDQLQFPNLADPFTFTFPFPQVGPNFKFTAVPEPSTFLLAGLGLAALGLCALRRGRTA